MYYPDPSRSQRLNLLIYLSQFGNELLLVVGAEGIGKTTLAQQFISNAPPNWRICHLSGKATLLPAHLLKQVSACFNLSYDGFNTEDAVNRFQKGILNQLADKTIRVLLVDDAQRFSSDTLASLLDLAGITHDRSGNRIRIILFAEPQIKTTLAAPELEQRRFSQKRKLDLRPLTLAHTGELILHRVKLAGLTTQTPFDANTIEKIYKQSEGYPERICEAAHQILLDSTQRKNRRGFLRKPLNPLGRSRLKTGLQIFSFLLLIAVVAGLLLFQERINTLYADRSSTITPATATEPVQIERRVALPERSLLTPPDSTPQSDPSTTAVEAAEPESLPPSALDLPNLSLQNTADAATAQLATRVQSTLTVAPKTLTPEATPLVAPPSSVTTGSEPIPIDDDNDNETSNEITAVNTEATLAAIPDAAVAESISPVGGAPSRPLIPVKARYGELWLLQQNPEKYTLQVIAGIHLKTLDKFIDIHQLPADALAYYHFYNKKGQTLHNLLYGLYPTAQAATNAITRLPPPLRAAKPWVRKITAVQKDIRGR